MKKSSLLITLALMAFSQASFALKKPIPKKQKASVVKVKVVEDNIIFEEKKNSTEPTLKDLKLDVHRTSVADLIDVIDQNLNKKQKKKLLIRLFTEPPGS